jgi:hypothetical protein
MEPGADTQSVALPVARPRPIPRLSAQQRAAVRDVWRAFWFSRLVVWVAGIAAVLVVGSAAESSPRLDPLFLTLPFDTDLANLLVAPAARFDSSWYLEIATFGYAVEARAAFFPLYPGLIAGLGGVVGSPLVAGIAISSASSLGGLYFLHRLTALDHGENVARATTWIVAWLPAALCFSAVYTEGLFLLLSVGSMYAARLGRWRLAAVAALLAGATRSAGVLLIVPLTILYLYGPRGDRAPDAGATGWRPRYRPRGDAGWLAAAPIGLCAYLFYLGLTQGDPLAAFTAQSEWDRVFAPMGGLALGLWSGVTGAIDLVGIVAAAEAHPPPLGLRDHAPVRNLAMLPFLLLAGWLTVEAYRRLPRAYFAYALASLALPLSVPATDQPLMSLPRFMLVAFPLWIALALWAVERGAVRAVVATSSVLMVTATVLFSAWAVPP